MSLDFEWDDEKAARNIRDHEGVTFEQAAAAFSDPFAVEWIDEREEYGEERSVLLGMTGGQLLSLQRHLIALLNFAPVESRFGSCKRRGKATFDIPINPCARSACSRSVAVGLYVAYTERGDNIRIISARRATRHEQDIYF